MLPRPGRARQGVEGEGVDIELGDLVALSDQPEELALGRLQGGVGHHVQQPDVELADVLVERPVGVQDIVSVGLETGKGRQVVVGDNGHGGARALTVRWLIWGPRDGGLEQAKKVLLVAHLGHLHR